MDSLKHDLSAFMHKYDVLGRVYIAKDGLNAQVSARVDDYDEFCLQFKQKFPLFDSVYFNVSPFKADIAFQKLNVKIRPQVVSDGIDYAELDSELKPEALAPDEFNQQVKDHLLKSESESILLDVRNSYELELGGFPKTLSLDGVETFREYMKVLRDKVLPRYEPKDTEILMVCTGGIRCSKAGLVLRNWGWPRVSMLAGGITRYTRELLKDGLFKGTNFTFDGRCGERFDNDLNEAVSRCAQCGTSSDTVTNCKNNSCNRMIVQCDACNTKFNGTCGPGCLQIVNDPGLYAIYKQVGAMPTKTFK